MTLTEFLLARIAEDQTAMVDEGSHTDVHRFSCGAVQSEGYRPCTCDMPARVLAECSAKRRIVERLHLAGSLAPGWSDLILQLLAKPYADHPDYQKEWSLE